MGRTKGKINLTDDQKARILAKKNSQIFAQEKIAESEGVSRRTVVKIKAELLPPEVVNLADKYAKEIVDNLKAVAMRGVANTLAKIDDLNAKDSMIVAATAIDKAQLLTSNPTSIVQQNSTENAQYFLDLIKQIAAQTQISLIEMFRIAVKHNEIPAEFRAEIERKLLAGSET